MKPKALKNVQPGDPITARMWNQLIDRINRSALNVGEGSGLVATSGPDGVSLAVSDLAIPTLWIAKTSSSITGRSGTAAGSGTVTTQSFDGTNLAADGTADTTAYNFSAATIATGKYCTICDVGDGYPFIISVEC